MSTPADPADPLLVSPVLLAAVGNAKDKIFFLKLESELEKFFAKDSYQRFPLKPMNAYYRRLVHQVAEHYLLDHIVEDYPDGPGRRIVLLKTPASQVPVIRIRDLMEREEESPAGGARKLKIMRRPGSAASSRDSDSQRSMSRASSEDDPDRSLQQREADYAKARARIFEAQQATDGAGPQQPQIPSPTRQPVDEVTVEELADYDRSLPNRGPPPPQYHPHPQHPPQVPQYPVSPLPYTPGLSPLGPPTFSPTLQATLQEQVARPGAGAGAGAGAHAGMLDPPTGQQTAGYFPSMAPTTPPTSTTPMFIPPAHPMTSPRRQQENEQEPVKLPQHLLSVDADMSEQDLLQALQSTGIVAVRQLRGRKWIGVYRSPQVATAALRDFSHDSIVLAGV